MRHCRAWIACLALLSVALPAAAQQHSLLGEARQHYEQGAVETALETLSRAEHASDLSLGDLLVLLELRILAARSMGDEEVVTRELRRLASIAPGRPPSSEFPPVLRERLADVRSRLPGALSLHAQARATATGIAVTAEVRNDPESVVREVMVFARAPGGPYSDGVDLVELPVTRGRVDYYALAVGPGGAVVAAHGSAEEPRTFLFPELAASTEPDDPGVSPWVWVGIGGGVLVAAAATVVAVLLLGSGGDIAQPTAPHPMP